MSERSLVLVVDDDKDLRDSVGELLEDAGYKAVCCGTGAAALEYLRSPAPRPDIILLDLMMPVMSGWEFREEQLRDPEIASIPVVVMTASRNLHDISADKVIRKPLTLDTLFEAVERHRAATRQTSEP